MKLSGMFRIGFVAAIVTALILLPSCIAVGDGDRAAGISTSQPDPHSEPTEQPRPAMNTRMYIKGLNAKTIADLGKSQAGTYDKVPFYDKTPLYSVDTPLPTIRQALRDYNSVGIVDAPNNKARLIRLQNGALYKESKLPIHESRMVKLFEKELDPDLHHLRNLVRDASTDAHPAEDIEHLPYANGKPILFKGSETLGHMIRAANTEPKSFYYAPIGKDPILVNPHTDKLIDNHIIDEERKLHRVVVGYKAAQKEYGQPVASIIWGKPIIANADSEGPLTSRIRLKNYPRFKHDASKEDMVAALKRNGRFRVYKEIDGKKYGYKVKVINPRVSPGEPFEFSVDRLSTLDRFLERYLLDRARLP
ncbi:uncharacterized protein UBRO_20121 [Ustilago bromivora]|uniref:Effector family protein Eff1 n=1 Tax=Ustilago bromivora TaxID=307758 RepID=A0A1K0GYS8_9BASI|nr:uncharacterized protein UBRO_20121 [Ustilago bromivora]SYW81391.1 uncharacterized protein UBRO2_04261 [Ustilago bromivora]